MDAVGRCKEPRGAVVVCSDPSQGFEHRHERTTHAGIARQLAALKGYDFVGEYDPSHRPDTTLYFVPSCTVLGLGAAAELGIGSEHDLFGGVVPYPFVATKAITHPLVRPDAQAPPGWSQEFGRAVKNAVLDGVTTFSNEDARQAGLTLLARGPVRVKSVRATGGRGQVVVRDAAALDCALNAVEQVELAEHGLVLEEDLTEVTTFSIGQVRVADLVASYYGTQRLTPDNAGAMVYGGSDLIVVRGDFDVLASHPLPSEARLAVVQARTYDAAARRHFTGLLASRRNYDIAHGRDCHGEWRSGVLEQSWRIGGASSAEIAALQAFRAEAALDSVRAVSVEVYGGATAPPPHALVYFDGVDERDGPITKYAFAEPHDNAR
jgi:Protein of unknown function (DUF3182)